MTDQELQSLTDEEFNAHLNSIIGKFPKWALKLFFTAVRFDALDNMGRATPEQKEFLEWVRSGFPKRPKNKQRRDFYYRYIASPEWKKKADEAKRRAGYRCQVCNRGRNEVTLNAHHRTYKNLGNEKADDLTVLCEGCHDTFHKAGKIARIDQ